MRTTADEPRVNEAEVAAGGGAGKAAYVRRIFSEIAPRYDLLNHLLSFNVDRRWRLKALQALNWEASPAGRFLDLCAGTLDLSNALAGRRNFRGTIVATDFALPMLSAGRGKIRGRAIHPVAADALSLPLDDCSVSGAVVAFGARNLADLEAGLHEAFRVLENGARLVILEFTTPRLALVRLAYLAYFNHLLPLVGRLISGHSSAYRYLPASVSHFPAEAELAARMTAAGFKSVSWRSLSFGIAAIHVGAKP
jgi:demethylmenaquinone methyltransferase/2-methoxy-6-polyprenyl-1,4-benzoquinol methylase